MLDVLQMQHDAYIEEGHVSASTRIDRIDRAIDMLVTHADAISDAMNEILMPPARDQSHDGCDGLA